MFDMRRREFITLARRRGYGQRLPALERRLVAHLANGRMTTMTCSPMASSSAASSR
jgi:hypothetical protein